MPAISPEDAVCRARAKVNADANVPARAWLVRRLDRPDEFYYLVVLGEVHAAVAVVIVGADRGEIQNWATLPGQNPHLAIEEGEAIERAGLSPDVKAELVWKPCRSSYSPLYPLSEIRAATRTVYVDQQGGVWPNLVPGGPGG